MPLILPSFSQTFALINNLSPEIGAAINRWIGKFEAVNADGVVTFAEIQSLVFDAQQDLMRLLVFVKLDGQQKKEIVLVVVGKLFDSIPLLPLPSYLAWLEWIPGLRQRLRAAIKAEVLELVDLSIETVYQHWIAGPSLSVFPPVPPAA